MLNLGVTTNILAQMSHCHLVLSYYDEYTNCKVLMTQVSKKCRAVWLKNEKAFVYCLPTPRIHFTYFQDFNEEIAQFLCEHDRYLKYKLELTVNTQTSANILMRFISEVQYSFKLVFTHLKLQITEELPLFVNELYT